MQQLPALQKALDVARSYGDCIIISADTVIAVGDEVLGKPSDPKHAKRMLRRISGQEVRAITGLTVMDTGSGKMITEHEVTRVRMRDMPERLIDDYVRTGEAMGKAGAFAIQGRGAILVKGIEGDFFNVVGLPLARLSKMLEKFIPPRIDIQTLLSWAFGTEKAHRHC